MDRLDTDVPLKEKNFLNLIKALGKSAEEKEQVCVSPLRFDDEKSAPDPGSR
jgi:hypothetical protein